MKKWYLFGSHFYNFFNGILPVNITNNVVIYTVKDILTNILRNLDLNLMIWHCSCWHIYRYKRKLCRLNLLWKYNLETHTRCNGMFVGRVHIKCRDNVFLVFRKDFKIMLMFKKILIFFLLFNKTTGGDRCKG